MVITEDRLVADFLATKVCILNIAMLETQICNTNKKLNLPMNSVTDVTTLCFKKKFPRAIGLTLSNLNRFSNSFHCWKAHKIATKPV